MTPKQTAARLADALERVNGEYDRDKETVSDAAQLLRQWPEAGGPIGWGLRKPDGTIDHDLVGTLEDCEYWANAIGERQSGWVPVPLYAAPSQQPAPAHPDEFVCPHCFDEGAVPQAAQSGMVPLDNDDVLWLWRDGDKMLAFRHLYPCYSPGGDPMTYGEPWGKAIFRHSHDRASAPQAVPQPLPAADIIQLMPDYDTYVTLGQLMDFARRVEAAVLGITAKGEQ